MHFCKSLQGDIAPNLGSCWLFKGELQCRNHVREGFIVCDGNTHWLLLPSEWIFYPGMIV